MHSYLVSLRISGPLLNPRDVSRDLGIEPTQVRIAGQPRPESKSLWTESMWEYAARPTTGQDEWHSLEEGLAAIFLRFSGCIEKQRDYQNSCDVCLFCGHFSDEFNGGPTLSPALLKSLGDFGVQVFLDTYSSPSAPS